MSLCGFVLSQATILSSNPTNTINHIMKLATSFLLYMERCIWPGRASSCIRWRFHTVPYERNHEYIQDEEEESSPKYQSVRYLYIRPHSYCCKMQRKHPKESFNMYVKAFRSRLKYFMPWRGYFIIIALFRSEDTTFRWFWTT